MEYPSVYTQAFSQVSIPRTYKRQVGYSTVSHEKVLHDYFVYHAIENTVANPVDTAHNGKVECVKSLSIQRLSSFLLIG